MFCLAVIGDGLVRRVSLIFVSHLLLSYFLYLVWSFQHMVHCLWRCDSLLVWIHWHVLGVGASRGSFRRGFNFGFAYTHTHTLEPQ